MLQETHKCIGIGCVYCLQLKQIRETIKQEIWHYRVTRPEVYSQNTPGFKDVSARQGHYTSAVNAEVAAENIRKQLNVEDELMDVQDWNNGADHGLIVRYGI